VDLSLLLKLRSVATYLFLMVLVVVVLDDDGIWGCNIYVCHCGEFETRRKVGCVSRWIDHPSQMILGER
jgi:hypothetical protein